MHSGSLINLTSSATFIYFSFLYLKKIQKLPTIISNQMFHCGCDPSNNFYSLNHCAHIYTSFPSLLPPPHFPTKPHRRATRRPKRAYIPLFPRPPTAPYDQLEQAQCPFTLLDAATRPASEPPTSPLPPLPLPQTRRPRRRHPPRH